MKIEDIPDRLPPHPEEERLREAERQLAATIRSLAAKVCAALEKNAVDRTKARTDAFVGLTLLRDTADAGRNAEATAIQDQMDQVHSK